MNFSFVDLILTTLEKEKKIGFFEDKITKLCKNEPIEVKCKSSDEHKNIVATAINKLKYLYLQDKSSNNSSNLLDTMRYYELPWDHQSDFIKDKDKKERIALIKRTLFIYFQRLFNDINVKPFSLKQTEFLENGITESTLVGTNGEKITFYSGHDYDINLKIEKDKKFCSVSIYQHLSVYQHTIHAINTPEQELVETSKKKFSFCFRKTNNKSVSDIDKTEVEQIFINIDSFSPLCYVNGTVYTDDGVYFFFNEIADSKFKIYYYDNEFIKILESLKASDSFKDIEDTQYIENILNKEDMLQEKAIEFLESNGIFSDCYCEIKADSFDLMDLANKAFYSPRELMESFQKNNQK